VRKVRCVAILAHSEPVAARAATSVKPKIVSRNRYDTTSCPGGAKLSS